MARVVGSCRDRASWTGTSAGRSSEPSSSSSASPSAGRVQGPLARLSHAAHVASARPAVTSLPWRTSGSRSRWTSARSRSRDVGVVHPQVAEAALAIGARRLVQEGRRAEPVDEPAQLGRRQLPLAEVDVADDDPALAEEALRGPRLARVVEPEDLDVGHALGRLRAERSRHVSGSTIVAPRRPAYPSATGPVPMRRHDRVPSKAQQEVSG